MVEEVPNWESSKRAELMEVSGVAFRRIPCLSGGAIDAHNSKPSTQGISVGPREFQVLGFGDSRAFGRPRSSLGAVRSNSAFCDNGHLQYYYAGPRCGGNKEKVKEKGSSLPAKKKLKLLKGLAKDLSKFSEMGFCLDSDDGLAAQDQRRAISEAAEVLMKQLQLLRAEEELKRKTKEEKSELKALRMDAMLDSESSSSSSSSESSDGECEEVIDMSCLRGKPHAEPPQPDELQLVSQQIVTLAPSDWLIEEGKATEPNRSEECRSETNEVGCCSGTSMPFSSSSVGHNDDSSLVKGTSTKRIEVCMGKKCKQSGSPALLEEFERVIGVQGAVVGCKCMGKCKDGPNVRVMNCADDIEAEGLEIPVRSTTNPLCLGVGLDDVGVIVSNLFGDRQKDLDLATAV